MATLDLDDPPIYYPNDWIGQGKTFSYADLPSSVMNTYKHAIELPAHLRMGLIPPATTPISDFVNVPLHASANFQIAGPLFRKRQK